MRSNQMIAFKKWIGYGLRLAVVAFLLMMVWTALPVWADDDDDFDTDEFVVKLNPAAGTTIEEINAQYGTVTINALLQSRGIYLLRVPGSPATGEDEDGWDEILEADPRILYAEPNYISDIPESGGNFTWEWGGEDEAPRNSQYAWQMLNLEAVHAQSRGAGIIVVVLDTGIQSSHPALQGRLTAVRYDFIDDDAIPEDMGNGVDDDGDGLIDEAVGHGTHVAGIIALVAPDAQIMPVRVLNSDGRGDIFRVAEGILFATENGAHVINLSLGSANDSDLLEEVIEEAKEDHGVVFVAAAGNLNTTDEQHPAEEDEVLAVSAIDEFRRKAAFASYGDWIDVVAPGVGVYSTVPANAYAYWSGTSMSTPFVAGQAALMRSRAFQTPAKTIQSLIRTTARPVEDANPQYVGKLGYGVIDPLAALAALCSQHSCQPPPLDNSQTYDLWMPRIMR
jgi:subtilisin family serine protease